MGFFFFFSCNHSLSTKIKILKLDTWHNIKFQLKSKFNLDSNCFFNQKKTQESNNLTSIFWCFQHIHLVCIWETRFVLPTSAFPCFFSHNCWLFLMYNTRQWVPCTVHRTHKLHFSIIFSLKMGLGIIHTFKNYFVIVFIIFNKISCIQTNP